MEKVNVVLAEGSNTRSVADELKEKLSGKEAELTIVFASTKIPDSQNEVVETIKKVVKGEVFGCSTAGEISSSGFHKQSIVALSIQAPKTIFAANTEVVPYSDDPVDAGRNAVKKAFGNLESGMDLFFLKFQKSSAIETIKNIPFHMLITMDGIPGVEEQVLKGASEIMLNRIQAAGGSAGDDLDLKETFVYSKYGAKSKAVSVAAIYTVLKIGVGIKQGFIPADIENKSGVVTENGNSSRVVKSINNKPARDVYMEWLGVNSIEDANKNFAENPLGVVEPSLKIWKVRSPAKILDDGSVLFYSDLPKGTGVVLFKSNKEMHIKAMKDAVNEAIKRAGNPNKIYAVILFDCILRDILSDIYNSKEEEILEVKNIVGKDTPIIGFSTYGETGNTDYIPMWHHNQTITAMIIGE